MQFVICGLGGQGILFASKVLGHIALAKGDSVMASEVHGMSQRGGSVISHFKIGDYSSSMVRAGEADVLLAFEQGEALRNYHFLREGGTAVVNVDRPRDMENRELVSFFWERKVRLFPLAGFEILKNSMEGRYLFLNVLILGALCATGAAEVTADEVRSAVEELAPAKFRADNLKAFELGFAALSTTGR